VRLVVIHTAEGARTTGELANYFSGPVEASSHAGIDDTKIEQYLPYDRAAWTMLAANPIADQVELCGFAAWTRDQWLTQHAAMLTLAAQWIRERCLARGIPIRKLAPAQLAAGEAGVCGHVDWTVGMRDGTHTDPGNDFPWDVVIAAAAGTPPTPVAPTPLPAGTLREADPMTDIPINPATDGTFRIAVMAEVGSASTVVGRAWITCGSTWGATTFTVTALDAAGNVMPGAQRNTVANNRRVAMELPSGCVMATIEGVTAAGAHPAAALVVLPK
jgi:hypothetical protein